MDLRYVAWQESLGEQAIGGAQQHLSTGSHMSHMSHMSHVYTHSVEDYKNTHLFVKLLCV